MEEGLLEKTIKLIIGIALIFYLAYVGLGILFKGGETVVNRMEDRATKSREGAKAKGCERAKLKYKNSPSEKARLSMEQACPQS